MFTKEAFHSKKAFLHMLEGQLRNLKEQKYERALTEHDEWRISRLQQEVDMNREEIYEYERELIKKLSK